MKSYQTPKLEMTVLATDDVLKVSGGTVTPPKPDELPDDNWD